MKKIIIFFFLINIFSLPSKAEIVYIDVNFIINKSAIGITLNKQLEDLKKKYISKYNKIEQELIKKEKTLIAQQNILNKDEFEKKLETLSKQVKKYRSDKKISEDDINKIKIENTKKILNFLNPIITEYVEKNSISLVIPKKNIIVGKKKLDITDNIIQLLNNETNK